MEHVMMVVPVDADDHEAEDVAEEHRPEWLDCRQAVAVRHLHLEHHDGDDDRNDAIAEGFQAGFRHVAAPLFRYKEFDKRVAFVNAQLEAIRAIPGVVNASATSQVRLSASALFRPAVRTHEIIEQTESLLDCCALSRC